MKAPTTLERALHDLRRHGHRERERCPGHDPHRAVRRQRVGDECVARRRRLQRCCIADRWYRRPVRALQWPSRSTAWRRWSRSTAPANGSVLGSTPTFSGQCSLTDGNVTVAITGNGNATLSAPCAAGAWSVSASPLGTGAYTATASQTDLAGNVGTGAASFSVDADRAGHHGQHVDDRQRLAHHCGHRDALARGHRSCRGSPRRTTRPTAARRRSDRPPARRSLCSPTASTRSSTSRWTRSGMRSQSRRRQRRSASTPTLR